jgi:starvation-inducible DNA-binding protein
MTGDRRSKKEDVMFRSPNPLPESARKAIARSLGVRLADGLDLHGQIKTAHWNIKGPHFAALHPLFDSFAVSLAGRNDEIAERAVALGGIVDGTTQGVAKLSKMPPFAVDTTRDLELVRLLADRIEAYLGGLRETRGIGEAHEDTDTVDLLTGVITEFEKYAWFLRATLGE